MSGKKRTFTVQMKLSALDYLKGHSLEATAKYFNVSVIYLPCKKTIIAHKIVND